jgi:hypothetical protein
MTSRRRLLTEGACDCTARLVAAAACTSCVHRDSMFRRSELGLLLACWQHRHGRVEAERLLTRRCSNELDPRASMLLLLFQVRQMRKLMQPRIWFTLFSNTLYM